MYSRTSKRVSSCDGFSRYKTSWLPVFSTRELKWRKSSKRNNWASRRRRHGWHDFICPSAKTLCPARIPGWIKWAESLDSSAHTPQCELRREFGALFHLLDNLSLMLSVSRVGKQVARRFGSKHSSKPDDSFPTSSAQDSLKCTLSVQIHLRGCLCILRQEDVVQGEK